jgi:hypothetical protein
MAKERFLGRKCYRFIWMLTVKKLLLIKHLPNGSNLIKIKNMFNYFG